MESTAMPTAQGRLTIAESASFSVADVAGNATSATVAGSDRSVLFDSVAPTLTLQQGIYQLDPTTDSTIAFRLLSNEALNTATVTSSDFVFTNATFVSLDTSDPTSIRIVVTANAEGAVTIAPSGTFAAADPTGNVQTSTVAGSDRSVTYDITAPVVSVAQAAAQADPARTNPLAFTVSANEALLLASVTAGDFVVTNGTIGAIDCSAAGCAITVVATGSGAVSIAPSADFSVADPAGNVTVVAGGEDRTITYVDAVAPTLTLAQAAGQLDPTAGSTIRFTLTADEPIDPATFTLEDLDVTNGTATIDCATATSCTITVVAATDGLYLVERGAGVSVASRRMVDSRSHAEVRFEGAAAPEVVVMGTRMVAQVGRDSASRRRWLWRAGRPDGSP